MVAVFAGIAFSLVVIGALYLHRATVRLVAAENTATSKVFGYGARMTYFIVAFFVLVYLGRLVRGPGDATWEAVGLFVVSIGFVFVAWRLIFVRSKR